MEYWQLLLLFAVGVASGFLNVIAGGGSTLALPVLIFMGLDSALANGTNRIAILIQNVAAVSSFRQQAVSEFKESLKLAVWTLPGAIAGAFLAVNTSDAWFQNILAIVMIGIIFSMVYTPSETNRPPGESGKHKEWLAYPVLLATGLYGGFIQVGVGFLFMATLFHLLKMDLVRVNMHKVFTVLIYTLPALAIFIATGNVNWILGLVLAAGSAIGGWCAARASVKGGEKAIRILLIIAMAIMVLKLFRFF